MANHCNFCTLLRHQKFAENFGLHFHKRELDDHRGVTFHVVSTPDEPLDQSNQVLWLKHEPLECTC